MTKPPNAFAARASPRKTALFLSPEPPFPAVGGGPLRSASIVTYLAQHYDLDVVTFRQPGAPDPLAAFPPNLARSVQVIPLPHHAKTGPARLVRNLKRALRNRPPLFDRFSGFEPAIAQAIAHNSYDVGVIEHFWCAPYAAQLRPVCQQLILDLHNIESAWHATLADSQIFPANLIHSRFAAGYRSLERKWLTQFDHLLVTSAADAGRAGLRSIIYPNALPLTPTPLKTESHEIIFTGNLEYEPNSAAILYFRNRIWPELRNRWPELTWTIAGKNSHAVQGLVNRDERIQLVGSMDDAVARIAQAQVAVVPLLAGSGTRIKIVEAWAAATPVVSTTLGAEGLEFRNGEHLLLADSPASFSQAVSTLLSNPPERIRIGEAGRRLYEERYTWPQSWKTLASVLGDS